MSPPRNERVAVARARHFRESEGLTIARIVGRVTHPKGLEPDGFAEQQDGAAPGLSFGVEDEHPVFKPAGRHGNYATSSRQCASAVCVVAKAEAIVSDRLEFCATQV
jgi:hypothetical protein